MTWCLRKGAIWMCVARYEQVQVDCLQPHWGWIASDHTASGLSWDTPQTDCLERVHACGLPWATQQMDWFDRARARMWITLSHTTDGLRWESARACGLPWATPQKDCPEMDWFETHYRKIVLRWIDLRHNTDCLEAYYRWTALSRLWSHASDRLPWAVLINGTPNK